MNSAGSLSRTVTLVPVVVPVVVVVVVVVLTGHRILCLNLRWIFETGSKHPPRIRRTVLPRWYFLSAVVVVVVVVGVVGVVVKGIDHVAIR